MNKDRLVPHHTRTTTLLQRGGVTTLREHEGGPITHIGVAINQQVFAYTPSFARLLLKDLTEAIEKMDKEGAGQ